MDETQQINLCIDEMAKLKEKMEVLEKQKILNEKNEMLKKTTMKPNLKVLEDWLVEYHNTNRSVTKNMIDERNKYISELMENKARNGGYCSSDFHELISPLKKSLSNYEQGLPVTYGMLIGDNYNKISYTTIQNSWRTKPSEVMKSHIEATYNMFNIINKRLDNIEKKLGINN